MREFELTRELELMRELELTREFQSGLTRELECHSQLEGRWGWGWADCLELEWQLEWEHLLELG